MVAVLAGAFMPWAVVGGVDRNGFETANLLLTLSADGVSDGLGWLGWLWYAAVATALVGWAMLALAWPRIPLVRVVPALAATTLLVGFVVTVDAETPLHQRRFGPLLAFIGLSLLVATSVLVWCRGPRRRSVRGDLLQGHLDRGIGGPGDHDPPG
ncbi:MAG: hypothetical protein RIB98_14765 [Acidimicrobiales bacterium]